MHSIAKLCADYLRAFSNNYGVKLKSSHAHELFASFMGYKSKAAMQADILCPIENLDQAQIVVLMPSIFIDERRKCLEDLPSDLPDSYTLSEAVFTCLESEVKFSGRAFVAWGPLSEVLTNEYLQKHGDLILPASFRPYERTRNIFNKPLYEFNPKIETTDNEIKLTVTNRYYGSHNVHFQPIDVVVEIELRRIAGYIGYSNPKISIINISTQSVDRSMAI
jgi:hypothetical protein